MFCAVPHVQGNAYSLYNASVVLFIVNVKALTEN